VETAVNTGGTAVRLSARGLAEVLERIRPSCPEWTGNDDGAGQVRSNPAGIDCPVDNTIGTAI
jgi:hypothetical protein